MECACIRPCQHKQLIDHADQPVCFPLHGPEQRSAPFNVVERAVFHWHKGTPEVTRAIVDAGHFVSVTPEIVYRERDRELVEAVPLESLLVESDAPWPYKGEFEKTTSGPWMAGRVAEEVAKIKRLPVEETMYRLTENACRLFHLAWA